MRNCKSVLGILTSQLGVGWPEGWVCRRREVPGPLLYLPTVQKLHI